MRNLQSCLLYSCLLFLGSCGSLPKENVNSDHTLRDDDVRLITRDDPENKQFLIEITAVGGKVCLSHDYWPNEYGQINSGADFVKVVTVNREYPLKSWHLGHCIHDHSCSVELIVGQTARANLAYSEFQDFDASGAKKKLVITYPYSAKGCGEGRYPPYDKHLSGLMKVE